MWIKKCIYIYACYILFLERSKIRVGSALSEQSGVRNVLIFPRVPSNFVQEWNDSIQSIQLDDFARRPWTVTKGWPRYFTACSRGGTTRHNKYRRRKRVAVDHRATLSSSFGNTLLAHTTRLSQMAIGVYRHPLVFDRPLVKVPLPPPLFRKFTTP